MTFVNVEKQGRAGTISLDRAGAMNALTLDMVRQIAAALDQFQNDPAVFCIVMKSANERGFCAGGDMRRVRELVLEGKFEQAEQFFREEYALIEKIARFPKPYISLIDGICMGGGMGLAVHGTYRIATERAIFAMPETMIGFLPDVGGSYFLSRMPNSCGSWMGLTGASVRGFDAHGLGISTHMTVAASLPGILDALCNTTRPVDDILSDLCASLGYKPSALMLNGTTACFNQPTLCSIYDCLEKYPTKQKESAMKALKSASPRSLQETLTLLRRGKELSLSECLEQEFEAMRRSIRHPDLVEGVRAVLVDKDHMPNWPSRNN